MLFFALDTENYYVSLPINKCANARNVIAPATTWGWTIRIVGNSQDWFLDIYGAPSHQQFLTTDSGEMNILDICRKPCGLWFLSEWCQSSWASVETKFCYCLHDTLHKFLLKLSSFTLIKKEVVYRGSLWKCWRYIFIIMLCFVFILFSCFSGCCFIKQIWVISSHR